MRDVVAISLAPLRGKRKATMQCYVVDNISSIANVRPEVVRDNYPHLHDIWFADVCRTKERLRVDNINWFRPSLEPSRE